MVGYPIFGLDERGQHFFHCNSAHRSGHWEQSGMCLGTGLVHGLGECFFFFLHDRVERVLAHLFSFARTMWA